MAKSTTKKTSVSEEEKTKQLMEEVELENAKKSSAVKEVEEVHNFEENAKRLLEQENQKLSQELEVARNEARVANLEIQELNSARAEVAELKDALLVKPQITEGYVNEVVVPEILTTEEEPIRTVQIVDCNKKIAKATIPKGTMFSGGGFIKG